MMVQRQNNRVQDDSYIDKPCEYFGLHNLKEKGIKLVLGSPLLNLVVTNELYTFLSDILYYRTWCHPLL